MKKTLIIAIFVLPLLWLYSATLIPAEKKGLDKRMDIEINNLLTNPYLKTGESIPPVGWDMGRLPTGGFEYTQGRQNRAFKLNAVPDKDSIIGQSGLFLVKGEKYRISGFIRGENFNGKGEIGIIGKKWANLKGFIFNTKNIKNDWYYFEEEFVHELDDLCRFVMFIRKGSSGSVVIERPILEPLTEKGLKGSRNMFANDNFAARYEEAKKKGFRSGPPSEDYKLVWQDEFDGTKLDETKWVNYYLDNYKKSRKSIVDSPRCAVLNGKGQLEMHAEYTDGLTYFPHINTKGKFTPTYGYFECRFKLHQEDMINATFWLQTLDMKKEAELGPVKAGHEIDIMETILPSCEQMSQSSHYLTFNGKNYGRPMSGSTIARVAPGLAKGWHTVGFEWTPDAYRWFIDGVESNKVTKDVHVISAAPLQIIISLEVHRSTKAKWEQENKNQKTSIYSIDYVRVYQKK